MKNLALIALVLIAGPALADSHASNITDASWIAIAKGLCMALAVAAVATGQGKAASTALDGIARNPSAAGKIQTPMIIALALMEGLVLFTMVICNFGM